MIVYKLTKPNFRTYNGFQWEKDKWFEVSGQGDLCGPGWFHVYTHPNLAVLLNPIHAEFRKFILWEAETEGAQLTEKCNFKIGVSKLRLVQELKPPRFITKQKVAFAIFCVQACGLSLSPQWMNWSEQWLRGEDREWLTALAVAQNEAASARASTEPMPELWAAARAAGAAAKAGVGAAKAASWGAAASAAGAKEASFIKGRYLSFDAIALSIKALEFET